MTTYIVAPAEIDPMSSADFARLLATAAAPTVGGEPADDVVLDCASIRFIDSSGLHALIDAHRRLEAHGARLVLHRPSTPLTRLLEISGLGDVLVVDN